MKYFAMAALFVMGALAHWGWNSYFSVLGLSPQVVLILTIAAGARQGPLAAMALGFSWGLFLDVFQVHLVGANALTLTLAGYIVGVARRQVDVAAGPSQIMIVLAISWGAFLLRGLLGLIFAGQFFWVGWAPFLFDPLYNCLVAPFLFFLWDRVVAP